MNTRTRWVLAHLVTALGQYEATQRGQGKDIPREMRALRAFVQDLANLRQGATNVAPPPDAAQPGAMTTQLLLTKAQTSRILGVSVRTLDRVIARGDLATVTIGDGSVRIRRADIDTYVANLAPRPRMRDSLEMKGTA